jgi:hypothetical protein
MFMAAAKSCRGGMAAGEETPAMEDAATRYFSASQHLRSPNPSLRLPAIAALSDLAHQAPTPIRARAAAALIREFGPSAVTHGVSGCIAPIAEVEQCYAEPRDCRTCPWFRQQPQTSDDDDARPNPQSDISMLG